MITRRMGVLKDGRHAVEARLAAEARAAAEAKAAAEDPLHGLKSEAAKGWSSAVEALGGIGGLFGGGGTPQRSPRTAAVSGSSPPNTTPPSRAGAPGLDGV